MAMINPIRSNGFTLIELLVVLVLVGVVLGMVAVQMMPDNRAVLREEAQRLALLLENAGLEARSSGQQLGWASQAQGYSFWKKNEYGDWVLLEDDALFRARKLPEGIKIHQIQVEQAPLEPGEKLALSASSFPLPYQIDMSYGEEKIALSGSSTGTVALVNVHEK